MAARPSSSTVIHHASSAAFHAPGPPAASKVSVPHARPVLVTTLDIVQLYRRCNPTGFRYQSALNPKRVLTRPSEGVLNGGADNSNSDLILYVNDILQNHSTGHRYQIIDMLGQGTFGQVAKCRHLETGQFVAVKVVKNKLAYFNQGLVEVRILELLNQQYDPSDQHHIVRLREFFVFKKHLCLVFEILSLNLYELIKQNQFRGLSISLVRIFLSQILKSLTVLARASVIHCDLKPENILLITPKSPQLKLIDFGSACFEKQTVYSYIQSRFYRSPEVLVGYPYKATIDMWSLGCIGAELFLGLPLFPGTSEYNQLARIVDMIGMPPAYLLDRGKSVNKFFQRHGSRENIGFTYTLKTEEEYARETGTAMHPSKKYFNYRALDDIIMHFPIKSSLSAQQQETERTNRRYLCDFLRGVLNLDPQERWTPEQAARHPFVTGNTHVPLPWHPEPAVSSLPGSVPLPIPSATGHALEVARSAPALAPAPAEKPLLQTAQHAVAPAAPPAAVAAPAPPPVAAQPPPQAATASQQSQAPHFKERPRGSGSGIITGGNYGSGHSPSRHERNGHQGSGRGRGKHERGPTRNRSQSFNSDSTRAGAETWGLSAADQQHQQHQRGSAHGHHGGGVPQHHSGGHVGPSTSPSKTSPQPVSNAVNNANNAASPARRQPPPLSVGSPPVPTPLPDKKNARLSGTFPATNPNTSPRQQDARPHRGGGAGGGGSKRRSQNGVSPEKDEEESGSSPGKRNSRGYDQKDITDKMAAMAITPPSKPPSSYGGNKSGKPAASPVPPMSPPRGSNSGVPSSSSGGAIAAPTAPAPSAASPPTQPSGAGSRSQGSTGGKAP